MDNYQYSIQNYRDEKSRLGKISNACGQAVIGFFVLGFIASAVFSSVVPGYDNLMNKNAVFTEGYLIAVTTFRILSFVIAYLALRQARISVDIPFGRPRETGTFFMIIPIILMVCFIGNIATSLLSGFVNSMFGVEFQAPEDTSNYSTPVGIVLSLVSTAVVPALVEEFAIRGVVMQSLRRYGDWFAVIMSSFVFALMHGNMIQIPFAFIAGIGLGYAAIRTGSLWTGIVIHFLNNSVAVIYSVAYEKLPANVMAIFTLALYGIIFVGGIICVIVDFANVRKPFACMERSEVNCISTGRKTVIFLTSIPMLIMIAFLCYETAQYIKVL